MAGTDMSDISDSPRAAWEIPLRCRDERCNERNPPIFEGVTCTVEDRSDSDCDSSDSGAVAVVIRWMCHHCGTTSTLRIRP